MATEILLKIKILLTFILEDERVLNRVIIMTIFSFIPLEKHAEASD